MGGLEDVKKEKVDLVEMLRRTRSQTRRAIGHEAPDASSDNRPPIPVVRDNGRGRGQGRGQGGGRGRGHGRTAREPMLQPLGEVETQPSHAQEDVLGKVVNVLQEVQGAIENLTKIIVCQEGHRERPLVETKVPTDTGVEVTLEKFLKLVPPSFSGSDTSEDPQRFIDRMEIIYKSLGCSSRRFVELASFQLEDIAQIWYDSLLQDRPIDSPPLTWDEFTTSFIARFLPQSIRDSFSRQFEKLTQTTSMTVSEYDISFTRLFRYAPHLVSTESMKTKRFIDGLVDPLYKVLSPQIGRLTYIEAVDAARRIEMREMDKHASREASKKIKIIGSFSGGGSYSRGPIFQSQPRAPLSGPTSYGHSSWNASTLRSDVRSATHRGPQSSGSSSRARPFCQICDKPHSGQCYRETGACFGCGQVGHLRRDCPNLQRDSS